MIYLWKYVKKKCQGEMDTNLIVGKIFYSRWFVVTEGQVAEKKKSKKDFGGIWLG